MKKFTFVLIIVLFSIFGCEERSTGSGNNNNKPTIPSNPYPVNGSLGINVNSILSWSCSDPNSDALTYDVYLGADPTLDDEELVSQNQSESNFDPGTLQQDTAYYWKIVAYNGEYETSSPVWSFMTRVLAIPSNPYPANGSSDISVNSILSWTCSDADGDTLTYDVYFGTSSNPSLVSSDQSSSIYDPDTLLYNTTYYWQIIVKDGDFEVEGNVWSFTTLVANIIGTVHLENESDHSGIQIGLYRFCELDNDIVEANNKWTQIGLEINQKTEFDHRENIPLEIVETDEHGDFTFSGILPGEYNLAIVKPGWGIKYLYDIEITNTDCYEPGVIEIFPVIELEGDISGSFMFENSKSYLVTDDVNFVPGSEVTIEKGSQILIAGNNLSIWGDFIVEQNPEMLFLVTNADGMDELTFNRDIPDRSGQIFLRPSISNNDVSLSYGKISYLENGLLNETNNEMSIIIENMRIVHCGCGVMFNSFANIEINNCVISNCDHENKGGINIEWTNTGSLNNNIIAYCLTGIKLKHRIDFDVFNNYIFGNEIGFNGLHFMGRLEHNEFTGNENSDVFICGTYGDVDEPMEIEYNNFKSTNGIISYNDFIYGSNCKISSLKHNNFENSTIFISISSSYPELDARYCYFDGLANSENIDEKIYDDDEDITFPPVNFSDFETSEIGSAGIE